MKVKEIALSAIMVLPSTRPTIEITGYRMVESQKQRKSTEILAERAALYKTENLAALYELRAWLWGNSDDPFEVTGKQGILKSDTQDFEIQNEARLLSPDGYLFQTSFIKYNAARKHFTGTEEVQAEQVSLRGPSPLKMTGTGFFVNLGERQYEILKNVRALQRVGKGEMLDVRAQKAVVLGNEKLAYFLKKVVVKSPQFDMSGERLKVEFSDEAEAQSPKSFTLDSPGEKNEKPRKIQAKLKKINLKALGLIVNFDKLGQVSNTQAIGDVDGEGPDELKLKADNLESHLLANGQNQIVLKGNVQIITNDRTANCEEAEYIPEIGEIILKRVASIKKEKQLLEGETIRFSTKNSEIYVEKARGIVDRKETGF